MRPVADGPGAFEDLAAAAAAASRISAHLRIVADGLDAAASVYPTWSVVTWSGLAAFEALRVMQRQPTRFRAAAGVFREAAEALSAHAARLRVAVSADEAAGRAPVAAAPGLRAHARAVAAASASELSARLSALSARAPSDPSWVARAGLRVEAWHDEAAVGAGESTAALIGLAARGAGILRGVVSPRTVGEVRCGVAGLRSLAGHPGSTIRALVDWDTWTSNPLRAAGRLVPDLFGGFGGARAARVVAASEHAARTASAESLFARQGEAARAATARLRAEAGSVRPSPGRAAWPGPNGLHLSPERAAQVERYHALSVAAEPAITASLKEVARETGTELRGLPTRRKTLDSAFRKASGRSASTEKMFAHLEDVVRFTFVAPELRYAGAVGRISELLQGNGYRALEKPRNGWVDAGGYRGFNSNWIDPRTGLTFEVQVHTPASWRAGELTHPWYEVKRVSPEPERSVWDARIRAAYARVPRPPGAGHWTEETFPARPPWLTPPPVPAPVLSYAGLGAGGPALAAAGAGRDPRTP